MMLGIPLLGGQVSFINRLYYIIDTTEEVEGERELD